MSRVRQFRIDLGDFTFSIFALMNDTATNPTLHPAKRVKLSHSTDSELPEEYSARVRVIEHDQFTLVRLVQTQLSAAYHCSDDCEGM